MNMIKLVDYSSSDEEKNTEATPTPIKFRGKRVFRRIIQSGGSTIARSNKKDQTKKQSRQQETPIKKNWTKDDKRQLKLNFDDDVDTPTSKLDFDYSTSTMCSSGIRSQSKTPIVENEPGIIKKKRWTKDESIRLKLALKASINPTTNEHWELICRSLGGKHTVDECKEQAKKLNWKPLEPQPEDEDAKANKEVEQELPILNGSSPWRRAVNNRKSRRSVECTNKFFNENVNDLTFNDLNLDDSLFTAAFSTPPEQAKCARRPFLIRVVADEDNEKSTTDDET